MTRNSSTPPFLAIVLILSISSIISTHGVDDVIIIRDGETPLVSESGIFVLGFFDPNQNGSSAETRYLGLWYNFSTDVVVWVANRDNPVTNSFGALQLTGDGDLIISQNQSSTADIVWSTNSSNSMGNTKIINPVAKLLDSGNLIITNGTYGDLIWQSFDYPTDTLLPGMKLGFNKQTGQQRYLTAWKQPNDPSPGEFVFKMDTSGLHEVYTTIKNKKEKRFGSWNGKWFVGTPRMKRTNDFSNNFVDNQTETFFRIHMTIADSYGRISVFPNNTLLRVVKRNDSSKLVSYESSTDRCDKYSYCGPNGICNPQNLSNCACFAGFHPKSSSSWSNGEYSMGCKRNEVLNCTDDEGFLLLSDVKTPETTNSTFDKNLSINECKDRCINNCSCMAYAPMYLETKIPRGCIMWYDVDLIDTVLFNQDDGKELYLRLPKSELPKNSSKSRKKTAIIATVVSGVIIISLFGIFVLIRKMKKRVQRGVLIQSPMLSSFEDNRKWKDEVPLFDFLTITSVTNNFSSDNKIGQGGFGVVYKGTMEDGQEVAVKRLSKASGPGLNDFMNEAVLIAKLQHRNLLQLLGCCMERDERILVYEFMKNKSLDTLIFGENRHLLDWKKRVEIIIGIARGLFYLHQDSGLRIIHRDLKPANVLLDEVMNPKISDFGTARLFGAEQLEENTRRVIGTYGYMSPEYANGGIFSIKSDVFSFGVLLLEIISGKKNRMYYQVEPYINLLERAWTLCKKGKSLTLLDESLSSSCSIPQVVRFIKIGLLCVQDQAIDRPTMSDVFLMLSNEISSVKEAKRPAFCSDSSDSSTFGQVCCTNNMGSLTKLDGR